MHGVGVHMYTVISYLNLMPDFWTRRGFFKFLFMLIHEEVAHQWADCNQGRGVTGRGCTCLLLKQVRCWKRTVASSFSLCSTGRPWLVMLHLRLCTTPPSFAVVKLLGAWTWARQPTPFQIIVGSIIFPQKMALEVASISLTRKVPTFLQYTQWLLPKCPHPNDWNLCVCNIVRQKELCRCNQR